MMQLKLKKCTKAGINKRMLLGWFPGALQPSRKSAMSEEPTLDFVTLKGRVTRKVADVAWSI